LILQEKLLAIFIDALRPDFISKTHTPYLYNLLNNNPSMELETILGYSDAIDATIFTGTYPDTNGYWMKYQYNPESSPFKSLKQMDFFKPIDYIPSHFIRSGINYVLYNTYYKKMSSKIGIDGFGTHNIPYNLIKNFDFSLYKSLWGVHPFESIPTIFDLLRNNNLKTYYSHGIKQNLSNELMKSSFSTIYLSDIDFYAHIFGLESRIFWNHVKKLDEKVEYIVENYKKTEADPNIMIFADHGMAQVNKILNFKDLLKHKDYNKRFFMVPDGTMLRFWYLDYDAKSDIRNYLGGYTCGNFLTNNEKKQLHLDFSHNKYFDDIFLLNQGYSIFPNFMSWNTPKAMHAYHPAYKEQHGALICCGKAFDSINERTAYLADLMPTMLECLNLEVPITCEGNSLVKK
jgi:predicted AlkP superfamily pyrophosphatase or phosphodiesterase